MVWFGERLDEEVVIQIKLSLTSLNFKICLLNYQSFLLTNHLKVLDAAEDELDECDLCLVVGTSSVVYPAAMFAPQVTNILIQKELPPN